MSEEKTTERLPPHDLEAEKGILAAILEDNARAGEAKQRLSGNPEAFYDLRNRLVWCAVVKLSNLDRPIDPVTLQDELKAEKNLEDAGGYPYLVELGCGGPAPGLFQEYISIVWEKYMARQLVQISRDNAMDVLGREGLSEATLASVERRYREFQALGEMGAITPKHLSRPSEFTTPFFDQWLRRNQGAVGFELPVKLADLRVRTHEMTLFTAENGAGKSTFLCHLAVVLMAQGLKVCVASLEVPPEITLWVMSRQLLGAQQAFMTPENDAGIAKLDQAIQWLDERVLVYNFLGIGNWRQILDAFTYAREKMGFDVFILDSALKIGIPDDDYAQQTTAANAFSDFCIRTGAHLQLVVHQRKGSGGVKERVRGAAGWTDAAHVVMSIKRNERKDEKIHDLGNDLRLAQIDFERTGDQTAMDKANSVYEKGIAGLSRLHDSTLVMSKQRNPASKHQNASRHIFFDRNSLQFHEKPDALPFIYMDLEEAARA